MLNIGCTNSTAVYLFCYITTILNHVTPMYRSNSLCPRCSCAMKHVNPKKHTQAYLLECAIVWHINYRDQTSSLHTTVPTMGLFNIWAVKRTNGICCLLYTLTLRTHVHTHVICFFLNLNGNSRSCLVHVYFGLLYIMSIYNSLIWLSKGGVSYLTTKRPHYCHI